ncbi:Protein of unknown function (DUF581) [Quillaja saponaria]|uniref:FLZ-type domain-containing protein n=1 Tax=Quillaja saponaria TaxID=32244 RepID=A0AAD7L3R1_QUISA|nr:Protein of unknown function (DUF581) [Quillaja saponaria]
MATSAISSSSPRSAIFYYAGFEDEYEEPHFLEACFLCRKPLCGSDIYMYRGNTPFCSRECRQEQIEVDEAKEKSFKISSSSTRALRRSDPNKNSSPSENLRTGTVAVA